MTQRTLASVSVVVIVLIITQLHLLRNVTAAYFGFYALALLGAVFVSFNNWNRLSGNEKNIFFCILILFGMPVFSMTIGALEGKYKSVEDIALGLSRLMFALPIYVAVLCAPPEKSVIKILVFTSAMITLLASQSILYQFVFGPISWFAESSDRLGLNRYASLFGSLTSLGIVCGFGILAAAVSVSSVTIFSFILMCIVIGSVLSLQKAAIVNIILALILLPYIRKFTRRQLGGFVFLILVLCALAWIMVGEQIGISISEIRLTSDSETNAGSDFSFEESIWQRILELPGIAIEHHGWGSLLLGLGPIGGSGAFGFPDTPMSHNGMVDILLIGGIPYFLFFLVFITFILKISIAPQRIADSKSYYYLGIATSLGMFINMPFSGLIIFTPSNAMFFALALKCLLIHKKNPSN